MPLSSNRYKQLHIYCPRLGSSKNLHISKNSSSIRAPFQPNVHQHHIHTAINHDNRTSLPTNLTNLHHSPPHPIPLDSPADLEARDLLNSVPTGQIQSRSTDASPPRPATPNPTPTIASCSSLPPLLPLPLLKRERISITHDALTVPTQTNNKATTTRTIVSELEDEGANLASIVVVTTSIRQRRNSSGLDVPPHLLVVRLASGIGIDHAAFLQSMTPTITTSSF